MGDVDPKLAQLIEEDLSAFTMAPDDMPGTPAGFTAAGDGLTPLDSTVLKEDGTSSAIEWRYELIHSGEFAGIPATNRTVTLEGVTLVRQVDGVWLHRRYIDWLSLFGQLGLTLSGRPVVDQIYPEVSASPATVVGKPKG
jgi:hypothetical protein